MDLRLSSGITMKLLDVRTIYINVLPHRIKNVRVDVRGQLKLYELSSTTFASGAYIARATNC